MKVFIELGDDLTYFVHLWGGGGKHETKQSEASSGLNRGSQTRWSRVTAFIGKKQGQASTLQCLTKATIVANNVLLVIAHWRAI